MFYKILKNLRNKKEPTLIQIKSKTGETLTDGKDIIDRWKEYFEELLGPEGDEKSKCNKTTNQPQHNYRTEGNIEDREHTDHITVEEVKEVLGKLKLGKAPGCDEIFPEMLKFMSDSAVKELTFIYNRVWQEKKVPEDWSRAVILPIYKKGDPKHCGNYRGISLLCVVSKIYETILEKRLRGVIEPQLKDQQSGFRQEHT